MEAISITLSESPHDVYFEIPSADHNDYPGSGGRSVVQIGIEFTIETSSDKVMHSANLYLFNPGPPVLVRAFDPSGFAIGSVPGQEIARLMHEWVQRNPPFKEMDLKGRRSTHVAVPKYAVVSGSDFHKSDSPFLACLVLHLSGRFIRLLLQLPQAGTTTPRISGYCEWQPELAEDTIAKFCRDMVRLPPAWRSHVEIQY